MGTGFAVAVFRPPKDQCGGFEAAALAHFLILESIMRQGAIIIGRLGRGETENREKRMRELGVECGFIFGGGG